MKLDWLFGMRALQVMGLNPAALQGGFDAMGANPGQLGALYQQYWMMGGHLGPAHLQQLMASGAPAQMPVAPPNSEQCRCAHHYAGGRRRRRKAAKNERETVDLAKLFTTRKHARRLERLVKNKPDVRRQLEAVLGGRIQLDGKNDGKLRVVRSGRGRTGKKGKSVPRRVAAARAALARIRRGAGGGKGDPFKRMMLGGLSRARRGHGSTDAVLKDPALTVEDKVTLMIMLIMKKMDRDIERQAQYINRLQQQQGGGGLSGAGTGGGGDGGGGGSSPSIDVETMKLKRLIDKRSQMFDMLRQIIDKYNQTAKNIIDSVSR